MPGRNPKQREIRVAVDTGGTFTDCAWVERGQIRMFKAFSTPEDPSAAIAEAVEKIIGSKIGSAAPLTLLHGTTVGTNALLQRKGARVALVTTAGFEDAMEIGRQARPKLYDFFFDRVEPLVPAELRFGIDERIGGDGAIVQALSRPALQQLLKKLTHAKPEAIAICLLFSFANPLHERAVVAVVKELGLPLSVSHQILPEFREYERTSTVVMNAYLQPLMQRYLQKLERRMQTRTKSAPRIFVMQSSGGITALRSAAREPVRTVLSGPAGGVVGAATMARRSGSDRIISLDMGGTSTDVALVDGEMHRSSQAEIAGLPLGVPLLDIHTVGAGGGSIARLDAAGALRVGPESAGADPGPICYGRGVQPTVTDANLILGRLRPDRFLGGDFTLDLQRARRLTREWLKRAGSKLTLEAFAGGVIRVVNATMEKAIRVVSIDRGHDPRDFALVAFGGAGGLHACDLAAALGVRRVIVPALPGALSAFGILVSDVVKDYSRTVLWRVGRELPVKRLDKEFAGLQHDAVRDYRAEAWRGAVQYRRSVDVRYRSQGYELNIPYTRKLVDDFSRQHRRHYGHDYAGRDVELVTLRLRATMKPSGSAVSSLRVSGRRSTARATGERAKVVFANGKVDARVYAREELVTEKKFSGPAMITEYSATTVVPGDARFWVDGAGNLVIALPSSG